ncbi:hypothetical protein N7488_009021 [Penicillium malachiteum]|nr:hypothetical protein N7488_009021 [Penicillium malachiteum]
MPWTPTTSGFTRPIGPNEVFMNLVSEGHSIGREHWSVNFTVTISPRGAFNALSDSPDLLATLIRYSWLNLRFKHPSLAAHVETPNIVYRVPGSTENLNKWASQTFTVATDAASADEVIRTIAPAADARLWYIPQSGELLLHSAHWRVDGVSGMLLLGQLVDLMTSHADTVLSGELPDPFEAFQWGSEAVRLCPSVEEAGNMPLEASEEHKAIAQRAVGTFTFIEGALGIPYTGDASTVPTGTGIIQVTLSPRVTAEARDAARARGLKVTAAVHASIAAVNFRRAIPEHKGRHYTSTMRKSLRPLLPEPYSTPASAASLLTTGWMMRADASSTWEENARMYQEEYGNSISKEYAQAHREYACTLVEFLNLPTPTEPPSDVDISSFGIMERYLEPEYGTPERGFSVMHAGLSV